MFLDSLVVFLSIERPYLEKIFCSRICNISLVTSRGSYLTEETSSGPLKDKSTSSIVEALKIILNI